MKSFATERPLGELQSAPEATSLVYDYEASRMPMRILYLEVYSRIRHVSRSAVARDQERQ